MNQAPRLCLYLLLMIPFTGFAQKEDVSAEVKRAMMDATRYMVENVATQGGYVTYYLPDLSRRWGELEFYPTQVQVQDVGVVSMGNVFLDAYHATGEGYYYDAAEKAARLLILGQLPCGGWNYMIDLAGDRSLQNWYNTIGKNAWGFEEFNHYYGNATFDDVTTSDAAKFLLRMYLEKMDPSFKPALDKTIGLVLESQYPLGGWPQRYPLKNDFPHGKLADYTSFYTFNDDVIWGNIDFLVQCYVTLGDQRLFDPIQRGMNFYLVTQQGNPQGGWAQQYDQQLRPAHARTYEPPVLLPALTYDHAMLLMKFYRYTGDRKFLARIPDAIQWLENTRLPEPKTESGKSTHPTFIEVGTNQPVYAHRTGTGVADGHYTWDNKDDRPLLHYGAKSFIEVDKLKAEFAKVNALSPADAIRESPLLIGAFQNTSTPQQYYESVWPLPDGPDVARRNYQTGVTLPDVAQVRNIVKALDSKHRWMVKHIQITRTFSIAADGTETNTAMMSEESGAGIRDESDQLYLSTKEYEKNMRMLIRFIGQHKK